MSKNKNIGQFILFCLVGFINTVVDLTFYYILHQLLDVPTFIASPMVVATVISLSYTLNAKIVFKSNLNLKQYVEFMLLTGVGVLLIQTTMSTLFEARAQGLLLGVNIFNNGNLNIFIANSSVRIVGVIFSLIWNFLFYKYVVFRNQHNKDDENVETIATKDS